jgi:hypothetical protein
MARQTFPCPTQNKQLNENNPLRVVGPPTTCVQISPILHCFQPVNPKPRHPDNENRDSPRLSAWLLLLLTDDAAMAVMSPYRTRDLCPLNLCPILNFPAISVTFAVDLDRLLCRVAAEVVGPNDTPITNCSLRGNVSCRQYHPAIGDFGPELAAGSI